MLFLSLEWMNKLWVLSTFSTKIISKSCSENKRLCLEVACSKWTLLWGLRLMILRKLVWHKSTKSLMLSINIKSDLGIRRLNRISLYWWRSPWDSSQSLEDPSKLIWYYFSRCFRSSFPFCMSISWASSFFDFCHESLSSFLNADLNLCPLLNDVPRVWRRGGLKLLFWVLLFCKSWLICKLIGPPNLPPSVCLLPKLNPLSLSPSNLSPILPSFRELNFLSAIDLSCFCTIPFKVYKIERTLYLASLSSSCLQNTDLSRISPNESLTSSCELSTSYSLNDLI